MENNLLPFEKIKRNILIKKEAKTDSKVGCKPEERKTEEIIDYGVVNIDKPKGPTSHQVSEYAQRILGIKKAGHSGTLDPAVTGVLPVALGRSTRIVQTLLTAGKEYVGIMHLHKEIGEEKLKETIKNHFTGKIRQLPPIKSSVKRELRTREIYYFEILEIDGKDALFKIGCQAGTYIRKVVHDLGQELNVGAHMAELRRTKAGPFTEENLFTLQDLVDAFYYYKKENNEKFIRKVIQPLENAIGHLPKIWVFDAAVKSLCHGAYLKMPGISKLNDNIKENDVVALMTLKDELIALGTAKTDSEKILKKEKGIAVKTEKVFMSPNIYK